MAGTSESSGTSFNVSQSTSTPVAVNTAQSDWGLTQSKLLSMLGDQQYKWAMQQYAKGEGVTDQTIANFLEMSGKGKGLADTLLTQYQDQIKPMMDQWNREAGSYASEGRQRFEAGRAMSTVAQADKAAMDEMARKIGDYGVNVNSGRYMDSMLAARTQDAAARAGAGTQAALNTEATGRQMQAQAINWGQNMPGQAINAVQSAYAGLTGAENAILGLMNTGANLAQSAAPFFNAAVAANKLPPVGQQSQSSSQGGSQQQSKSQQTDPPQRQPQEKQPGQGKPGKGEGGGDGEGDGEGKGKGKGEGGGKSDDGGGGGPGPARPITPGVYEAKSDDDDGTGAAPEGYTGPVPYLNPDGTIASPFEPGLGRDAPYGQQFGPDTPQWGGEQVANWTLPEQYGPDPGFNADPAAQGADNPMLGSPFGPNSLDSPGGDFPSNQDFTEYDNYDPPTDPGARFTSAQPDEYDNYDQWGGQDFSGYNESDDTDYTNYDTSGDEDTSYYDDWDSQEGYTESDDAEYDYDASGDEDTSYYDDWDNAPEQDDQSYYDDSDYEDNSYYDEWDASGDDGGWYESDGGGYYNESGYGGEEFSGGSEDYYAQGGRVRRPPPGMRRPGGPPRQRPMPKPNGALSQRPMLRRPSQQSGVLPTTGGAVPRSASPSQGRQTDDISARLNAGEYVIPRDVVKHQGTKFFTDLIQKSRKLRTGMAGDKPKPTLKPALPAGRPTFNSRALPPR